MSLKWTQDCISLLTAVVTEICDDSEDEDLLPLEAIEECMQNNAEFEQPKKKVRTSFLQNKIAKGKFKYIRPSRFENVDLLKATVIKEEVDLEICKTSLKPSNNCICKKHINRSLYSKISFVVNQKGGSFISDSDFKLHWRMTRSTVETVYHMVQTSLQETPITPIEFLAVLWSLATDESLDAIASRFKVAKDNIPLLQRAVFDAVLAKRFDFERWPRGRAAKMTISGFQTVCGLPAVLGAVDMVHFNCNGMPYAGTFFNQNYEKKIIFELACDHRGSFTYSSYFWWPGKWITNEIFEQSTISTLPLPTSSYLLGSWSYAPFKNFVVPFSTNQERDQNEEHEKEFNIRHDKAMRVLRKAVFSLVTRFGALRLLKVQNAWHVRKQFATCLILHNMCVELEDDVEPDSTFSEDSYFPTSLFPSMRDAEEELRNQICLEIMENSVGFEF